MLGLVAGLGLLVAGQASNGASNSAGDTVTNAMAKVADLTCGFLALALLVLLDTLLLKTLGTDQATNRLLGRANGLVP